MSCRAPSRGFVAARVKRWCRSEGRVVLCRCHVYPIGKLIVLWCCVCGVSQPPRIVASRRVVSVEVDPVNRGVCGLRCRNRRGVVCPSMEVAPEYRGRWW